MLPELLATGRYPRFAAAIARGGAPETFDPAAHFDRLLDRILDGLVRPPGTPLVRTSAAPRCRSMVSTLEVRPSVTPGLMSALSTRLTRGDRTRHRVHGVLDHGHHLVPVALDRREHRVGPVRQAAGANHPDRLGDDLADTLTDTKRRNRKSDQHAPQASEEMARIPYAVPRPPVIPTS